MKHARFKYKQSRKNKEWYFRLVAANGQTVMQSEGYKSKSGCLRGIDAAEKAHSEAQYYSNVEEK